MPKPKFFAKDASSVVLEKISSNRSLDRFVATLPSPIANPFVKPILLVKAAASSKALLSICLRILPIPIPKPKAKPSILTWEDHQSFILCDRYGNIIPHPSPRPSARNELFFASSNILEANSLDRYEICNASPAPRPNDSCLLCGIRSSIRSEEHTSELQSPCNL